VIQFVDNLLQHSLCIAQHLIVPEPQHPIARLGQKLSPPLIRFNLISMMSAIQLNDQPRFWTEEVHDVATDWLLPSELKAVHLSAAQLHPQFALGVGLIMTEAFSAWTKHSGS